MVRGPAYGPLFHFISVRFNAGQITSPRILEWLKLPHPGKARERTGAGMMDCKKALTEANGDIELAIENMRKSGAIKAAKKQATLLLTA